MTGWLIQPAGMAYYKPQMLFWHIGKQVYLLENAA